MHRPSMLPGRPMNTPKSVMDLISTPSPCRPSCGSSRTLSHGFGMHCFMPSEMRGGTRRAREIITSTIWRRAETAPFAGMHVLVGPHSPSRRRAPGDILPPAKLLMVCVSSNAFVEASKTSRRWLRATDHSRGSTTQHWRLAVREADVEIELRSRIPRRREPPGEWRGEARGLQWSPHSTRKSTRLTASASHRRAGWSHPRQSNSRALHTD
jgi:hypothetical protein